MSIGGAADFPRRFDGPVATVALHVAGAHQRGIVLLAVAFAVEVHQPVAIGITVAGRVANSAVDQGPVGDWAYFAVGNDLHHTAQ